MAAKLEDVVLDSGLSQIDTGSDRITICQSEPTTYALATTGHLGLKSFGAGSAFGSPAAGAPNGRKVTSAAITDGTILTTGTASWWAVVTTAALQAHGTLSSPQSVTSGNTFSLAAFDIRIPGE